MSAISKFLTATAVAGSLTFFSASAQAAVFIGTQAAGEVTVTQRATDADLAVWGGNVGGFEINTVQGVAGQRPSPLLASGSINADRRDGTTGVLDIFVTSTDIADAVSEDFLSGFTTNFLTQGWTVQLRTYVSAANELWTGQLIGDHTFTDIADASAYGAAAVGQGLYSVTHRYTITANGAGSADSTITVAAVPEPGAWALMIMGLGGAGAMLRSRRKQGLALA